MNMESCPSLGGNLVIDEVGVLVLNTDLAVVALAVVAVGPAAGTDGGTWQDLSSMPSV